MLERECKILLGHTEVHNDELYSHPTHLRKVGTVYDAEDFASFYPAEFYNNHIYIPIGSTNILKQDYGSNVLNVMINKDGTEVKIDQFNIAPRILK